MEWKIIPRKSDDLIQQLLINRGIKTNKDKENFFHPKLTDFKKDLQIPGIPKAGSRIKQAIKNNELIIAYGDYDVDGVCGAAVLYLGLTSIGAKVLPYIPHREKEGYGLSKIGLQFAKEQGAKLVISCDCGIVNFEESYFAKEIGLDLIITDHHQTLDGKLPQAEAIVHSTKLCGTAVAWCLVKTLISEKDADKLLDLVAIATISDMMPLLGVNRALVKEGLKILNKTDRVGLLALFNEADIKLGKISTYEIGHMIAPRLNAMGRLEHAIDALRLICTKDPQKAFKLASLVSETNVLRKKMTQDAIDQARLQVTKEEKKIYVLSDKSWSPGIVSLVAGRICEETRKPTIAISIGETHSKGSARSYNGVNIVEVMRKCQDILIAVGGHPNAAGFTIETSKIKEFEERMEGLMEEDLVPGNQILDIEAEIKPLDLKMSLMKDLADLEPFGMANPKPIFALLNAKLTDLRTVSTGKHLKGNIIVDFTSEGRKVPFIAFGMGEMKDFLADFANLAFSLEIDNFNGFEKLQLKIKDIHTV